MKPGSRAPSAPGGLMAAAQEGVQSLGALASPAVSAADPEFPLSLSEYLNNRKLFPEYEGRIDHVSQQNNRTEINEKLAKIIEAIHLTYDRCHDEAGRSTTLSGIGRLVKDNTCVNEDKTGGLQSLTEIKGDSSAKITINIPKNTSFTGGSFMSDDDYNHFMNQPLFLRIDNDDHTGHGLDETRSQYLQHGDAEVLRAKPEAKKGANNAEKKEIAYAENQYTLNPIIYGLFGIKTKYPAPLDEPITVTDDGNVNKDAKSKPTSEKILALQRIVNSVEGDEYIQVGKKAGD